MYWLWITRHGTSFPSFNFGFETMSIKPNPWLKRLEFTGSKEMKLLWKAEQTFDLFYSDIRLSVSKLGKGFEIFIGLRVLDPKKRVAKKVS